MFLYYLKETFNTLFKQKLASLLIITTTAIAIIFVLTSLGLLIFSKVIDNRLKENIQINLFINDTVSTKGYNRITADLETNIYVQSAKFVSKEEALKRMKRKTGTDFSKVLDANPLPAMFAVKLNSDSVSALSISPIIETLQNIKGVDEVIYDYTLTLKILNFINSSKKVVYGISIFLVLLSIYLVYSNNRLVLNSRMDQYNTMKLVGAKLRTIKIPIILNGIVMGIIASTLCLAALYGLEYFGKRIYDLSFIESYKIYTIAVIFILGIILGFLGSYLSTLNVTLKITKVKR